MTTEFSVGRLRKGDTDAAASLVRSVFPIPLHPYLAYCQRGLGEYLGVFMEHPALFSNYHLYGAWDRRNRLIGFAEFRGLQGEDQFLTYLAVAPTWRRAGVATGLLSNHLNDAVHSGRFLLDVFANNTPARRLYGRLGLRVELGAGWIARRLEPLRSVLRDDAGSFTVQDFHQSAAARHRYGFCQLHVQYERATYLLGHTSATALRVPSTLLGDERFLQRIIGAFPWVTDVFCVAATAEQAELLPGKKIVDSLRMSASIDEVREALRP